MEKNKILKIVGMVLIILLVSLGAIITSIYSKKNTPSEKSKINFYFDMGSWNYDEKNNVYYKMNVNFCEKSKNNETQRFNIFVPGEYLQGEKNSNGTYKCNINSQNQKNIYNVKAAPIIIAIETEAGIEQKVYKKYDYEKISDYINEGYVCILPGIRGGDNKQNNNIEENNNAIIDGVTDLKALVRFLRFNKEIIPGNTEKIISYGSNGGGAMSAILGASGDSELYSSKLLEIGAIMSNDDGKGISDSVNGTMCCSPINNYEIEKNAYEWLVGQYLADDNNEKKYKQSALKFANYINNMKLKSEDGTLLYLDETKQDVYAGGTYYSYMKAEIEKTINTFIQNTAFPYRDSKNNTSYDSPKEYVNFLNSNSQWIVYDESTNTVNIDSFKGLSNYFRDKNTKISESTFLNEYNPYYYLSNKYAGLDSSYVAKYWNICTLVDENVKSFLPEENLKLVLLKNEDVKKIKHICLWAINYSDEEKQKIQFDDLKKWIKECFNY